MKLEYQDTGTEEGAVHQAEGAMKRGSESFWKFCFTSLETFVYQAGHCSNRGVRHTPWERGGAPGQVERLLIRVRRVKLV